MARTGSTEVSGLGASLGRLRSRPPLAAAAGKTLIWCLLGVVAAACTASGHQGGPAPAGDAPTVTVQADSAAAPVPSRFDGFSIETSNLCYVIRLAKTDPAFVQLFRTLGPGVFRVGGDTGDRFASWSAAGQPDCAWNHMVVTPSLVQAFFRFAQSVGYRVMWQVPLDNGDPAGDAAEGVYVSGMPDVYSIEMGDEPNIYPHCAQDYQTYIDDWDGIYRRYQAAGGKAPMTGPAVTGLNKCYAPHFLQEDASRIAAFTVHYYVAGASTKPTCTDLINYLQNLNSAIRNEVALSRSYGLPIIVNETNTYSQHGMPGVSNAFCSALWAADYLMLGQVDGLQGIYFHGTANDAPDNWQGKLSYITPITARGTPAPEYYGLLFYHQMAQHGGSQLSITKSNVPGDLNIFAIAGNDSDLRLAIINRGGTPAALRIATTRSYARASEISLSAPYLGALSGVTLGGTRVAANGTWAPDPRPVTVHGTSSGITVPSYTGVIVTYSPGR